jgi:hypothetical protein
MDSGYPPMVMVEGGLANFEQRPYCDILILPMKDRFRVPKPLHNRYGSCDVYTRLGFDNYGGEHTTKHIGHGEVEFNIGVSNWLLR